MIELTLILVAVAVWVALFKGDPAELTGTEYDAGVDLGECPCTTVPDRVR